MRCLVPKVCLGGCKTMVHWSGARGLLAALIHDGSDGMGPAEVTGHPGQRQPAVNALSTPRLPCILPRLHPSSRERQPLTRRTISRTRPACRCPRQAPFPAPVARNSSCPPSHARRPSSASVSRDSTNSLHHNSHTRLELLLDILRRLRRICSAFLRLLLFIGSPILHANALRPTLGRLITTSSTNLISPTLLESFAPCPDSPFKVLCSEWCLCWRAISKGI